MKRLAIAAMDRIAAWWSWRPVEQPEILLDPDGEGVFVHAERAYFVASRILGVSWRDLDAELVWMRADNDGEHWRRVAQTWRLDVSLNLPNRWHRGVSYLYFWPRPEHGIGLEAQA